MGFSGGIWTWPSLPGSWNPAISGQAATPADWNTYSAAGAQGLSTMICRDGQSTVTADIPFAGFRLKGVGNGVLATDAANMSQLVSGAGVYAIDTGTADNYAIAPTPAISAYVVGQAFRFKVIHANATTTPALAVSGLTAGTISYSDGSVIGIGALAANALVDVIVATATPTFHLQTRTPTLVATTQSPGDNSTKLATTAYVAAAITSPAPITNSLSGDVACNNTANYFDGPSVAQGTVGTWFVSGTVTVTDTAIATFFAKLWDGTTVIASCGTFLANAVGGVTMTLSGFITSPAGNLRISVKDSSATTGSILFNLSGNSKDSTITAIRIA